MTVKIKGKSLKQMPYEHQLIAILTKKLGGEVSINLEKEAEKIKSMMIQATSQGKILIKAE